MQCPKCSGLLIADSTRRACVCGYEDYDYTPVVDRSVLPEAFKPTLMRCAYGGHNQDFAGRVIMLVFNRRGYEIGRKAKIAPSVTVDCPYCRAGQVMQKVKIDTTEIPPPPIAGQGYMSRMRLECARMHRIDVHMSPGWKSASWMEIYE